ncbi:hypothetical protein BE04_27595 [Sorangium cellulosum]|uniref:Uncharacterized protein n=1 Tax=Sorangium cellulosum TaxID=56 RepID=A0A150PH73_SORCE|nr:hypothetical protein BE04_27595 [Sorangium cellulosum]
MRNLTKVLVTMGSAAAVGLVAARARAQAMDVEPPLPNVLLLVDTSGSMEKTVAGGEPDCNPLTPPASEALKSRWTKLVESLTGPIPDFSCYAQPRTQSEFIDEFTIDGEPPYDANYYIPFHRLLSNGCTPTPDPPLNDVDGHRYDDAGIDCAFPYNAPNGLLDVYQDRIRFSLMTFDTLPDARTGLVGGVPNAQSGMRGMWSYFLEFQSGAGYPARGNPPDCAIADMEVGAKNPAAPLWEGPLIPFPTYDADIDAVRAKNLKIQKALLATRPYGATPLAGMLSDARDYILNDASLWEGQPLGPRDDPYISGGCRKTSIVLVSDGEPNLDLRPTCAQGPGPGPEGTGCPYEEPHVIAHSLNTHVNPNRRVRTYAVGFGLTTQARQELSDPTFDCARISSTDFLPAGRCDNATGAVRACCTLSRIAIEGGTDRGYFPDDANELSAVMSQIFARISANSTSRTLPVFAMATSTVNNGSDAAGVAYQFGSSFSPPADGSLWSGNLERKRYVCESVNGVMTTQLEDVDPGKGDDFAANVSSNDLARPRRFLTVIGDLDVAEQRVWSQRTIRPAAAAVDDLSDYTGTVTGSGAPAPAQAFADALSSAPRALGLNPSSGTVPSQCSGGLQAATAEVCAERIIEWETGEPMPANVPSRDGNELGSIYHSTPVVVGAPRDYIPDESYRLFAEQPAQANRPLVLYTATTDGQLHAFQVTAATATDPLKVDRVQNNELWSFLPPYVLPRLLDTFNQQSILLDGAPVVKNVVFERTSAQISEASASWSTVLLAGGGAGGGFYYALDVTNPTAPRFLWQLSTDEAGNPLFGASTPTPAIGMVEMEDRGQIREIAVAILPGGSAPLDASQPACNRKGTTHPLFHPTGSLSVRSSVRCWGSAGSGGPVGPARSLTIVRLETGEVLRTFRGLPSEAPSVLSTRTTEVDFDSPITGVPVPFPAGVGEVAERIYVGDADGTLWRVNLSSTDPDEWSVSLAWDAYSITGMGDAAASSQPIQTTPIVSTDPLGNTVVLFSTGDQESFTPGVETRVWSITERPHETSVRISENWVVPLTNGKRVTGPISLFNGCAYFATFTPVAPGTFACADGFGSIWGVDYLVGQAATPAAYPNACLVVDPLAPPQHFEDQAPGTVVFGVAVTQKPTCTVTEEYTDVHFGTQTIIRQSTPPEYQLVFHTGAAGQEDAQGGETRTTTRTLQPPRKVVKIDSWATILE